MKPDAGAPHIFISYSHTDTRLVKPVVKLLRAMGNPVFRDADAILGGSRWRNALDTALKHADLVVIFWCAHAGGSTEVALEWERAISNGTDVLPLLLDDTALPPPLNEYQWVDFRAVAGVAHARRRSPRRRLALVTVPALVAGVLLAVWVWPLPWRKTITPRGLVDQTIRLPEVILQYACSPFVVALTAAAVTVTIVLWWRLRAGKTRQRARLIAEAVNTAVVSRLRPERSPVDGHIDKE